MYSSSNITSLSFNQDHGCFACAMDDGTRIYNMEPLREKTHLDAGTVGSVSLCEMLYRTNILAIVGGGKQQKFAENTVLIWDDLSRSFISEFTFPSPVLSLKLRRDRLYVALRTKVHIFCFPKNPAKLFSFDTGVNPRGLCEVSPFPSSERQLLVFPGSYSGSIQIIDLARLNPGSSAAPIIIKAHTSNVAYVTLNDQGTWVATASIKGTLIRIFDTYTKVQLIELRRGTDTAALHCINFSSDSDFLCASSDKGTVHVFALKDTKLNKRLAFTNPAKLMGSYGGSQWAFASFNTKQEQRSICAFGSNSSIYAVCMDGSFQKYVFTNNGNCNREQYDQFLTLCNNEEF